jgi:endonuclease/exonuclease/phosphatase family metal-dependent hydrolase
MRVVTWNVWWRFGADWRRRQDGILGELARLRPDLVGLQESWAVDGMSQAGVLGDALGLHAAFAGPSLPPVPDPPETPDQEGVALGVGLLSRFPIVRLVEHHLPARRRDVQPVAVVATVAPPAGEIDFVVSCVEWEPEYLVDHVAQTEALAGLVRGVDPSRPVVIAADLNAAPGGPELAPLLEVMTDCWTAGGGDEAAATLSSTNPFAPREAVKQIDRRIDHVLARPGANPMAVDRVALAGVHGDPPPSDHYAVVVDLHA